MDPICNGSFLRVSHENAIEAYIGMGIPREDAEILTDPTCKNRFEVEVCGNGIKWQEFYPTLPKYNQTYNLRVGEAVTFTTPIAMTITATKKDGRTVTFEFLAGGKKTTSTSTFSPEGLTVKGCNDAGVEHTEVFARQEPEVSTDIIPPINCHTQIYFFRCVGCSCWKIARASWTCWSARARTELPWKRNCHGIFTKAPFSLFASVKSMSRRMFMEDFFCGGRIPAKNFYMALAK